MAWIARLIALGLVAVLADAAFASLHGTTQALDAAGGGAVVALIGLALLWRHPWVAVAFAVFALACAFAVGTLNGVAAGPALADLGPADAAALVFAFGIFAAAVAAFVAVRNAVARVLVLLLALYALVTTGAAVKHGGLGAAFGSAPLAWTRGPYAAAEVMLPLAAAAALIYGLVQLARRRGAAGATALVLALALAATTHLGAFAAGAAGLPTITAFENAAIPARAPAIPTTAAATNAPTTTRAVGTIAADTGLLFVPKGSEDVPPEIVAAAATITKDPQHALEAVAGLADDLYPGALGGSVGALRSGSANSVDKALLLRDLIRAATPSIETAFARCTLAPADSDAIVAQARSAHNVRPPIVMQSAAAASTTAGDTAARATLQRWAKTWKALVAQTQDEGKKLGGELRSAGLALPPGQPAAERLRALAADHVWVRARVNGNWLDLDPTVEPAAPGKTRCTSAAQTAALPDDLYDVLGVRIASEEIGTGGTQRTTLLDRTMRTADIGDRDVSFMFAEPVGMDAALNAPSSPPVGASSFTPLLRVGDENIIGMPILLPVPAKGTNAVAKSVTAAAGALDQMGASPSPTAAAAPASALPVVTGVWMELSVTAPGTTAAAVQSPIFDRIGFAARAAHAAPPSALAAQPDANAYRAMQTVWNVVVSAGHAASAGGPANAPAGSDVPALSRTLASLHGAYYALRGALFDDAHGTGAGVAAARPGISLLALANNGPLMDVASDDALPLAGDEARPAWAAASLMAERELLNAKALLTSGDLNTTGSTDALAAFDRASAASTRMIALHPADGAAPQSAAVPDEARARISARLAQGDAILALAPTAAVAGAPPYAYWVLDPAGTLRDENVFGRHQEGAEDAVVTEEVAIKNISTWRKFTCTILPIIRAAGFALSVAHGSLPFSPAGASGLAGVNKAASDAAVEAAQDGLDKPVACGAP